jgi:hypothetical protein
MELSQPSTDLLGHRLLAEVNLVRAVLGAPPIGEIFVTRRAAELLAGDVLGPACGCGFGMTWIDNVPHLVLRVWDEQVTREVATALDTEYEEQLCEVRAPKAMDSFDVAAAFGFVFVDLDGSLLGWIDPADEDQSVWNLHLLPGKLYPPGHAPRGHNTFGRSAAD